MESAFCVVGARDLLARIRQRLLGLDGGARLVVWQSGGHRVVVHTERLQARLLRGWLVVSVELETEQTGRVALELVYFLGNPQDGDGTAAAVRINAPTHDAAALAEVWGADLQRVVWDAVLDAIQLALVSTRRQQPGSPLTLRGFHVTPDGLQVNLAWGEA